MCEFIAHFPALLAAYPKDPAKASQPFPSPRSWTNVVKLLAAADSVDADEEVKSTLIYGCVGQEAGTQFLSWLSQQDLPDPEGLLRDPSSLKLPLRGDLACAIVASVLGRVQQHNTPERWEAARDVLEVAFGQSQEISIAAYGKLRQTQPKGYLPKSRNGVANQINAILMGK